MIDLLLFLYVLLQEKWFGTGGDCEVQNVLEKISSEFPEQNEQATIRPDEQQPRPRFIV